MVLSPLERIIEILKDYLQGGRFPFVSELAERDRDPFAILISTVLSARTKDEVTLKACARLFSRAKTPFELAVLSLPEIEALIYPVGFYRTKARHLKEISTDLVNRFQGQVPDSIEELLSLPGVGRKTANLVLALAFEKDAICVDTHVHRIMNRIGILKTNQPKETELKLMDMLPRQYWRCINTLLVKFGQDTCLPLSPYCTSCPISLYCRRIGVKRHR